MNKRGYELTLEKLVVMIPKIIILVVLLILLFSLYNLITGKREKDQGELDLKRIAREISLIGDKGDIDVPILAKKDFKLDILNAGNKYFECKEKACICVSIEKDGGYEPIKCETFSGFGEEKEEGKFYFVGSKSIEITKQKLLRIKREDNERKEISLSLP